MNYFTEMFSRERGTLGIVGEPATGVNWIGHLYLRHLNYTPNLLYKSDVEEYIVPNFLNRMRYVINDDLTMTSVDPTSYDSPLDIFHYKDVRHKNGWANIQVKENNIKQVLMLDTTKIDKHTQTKLYKLHYIKRRLSSLISISLPFNCRSTKKLMARGRPHFPLIPELLTDNLSIDDRLCLFMANLYKKDQNNVYVSKEELLSKSNNLTFYESEVRRFKEYNHFLLENFKNISPLSSEGIVYFSLRKNFNVSDFKDYIRTQLGYNYITAWGSLSNNSQHESLQKCQQIFLKYEIPFFKVDYYDLFYRHNDTGTPLDNYKKETAQYTIANRKVIQSFDEQFI